MFVQSNYAAEAEKCGSLDRVVIAIHLAQVLYPDLKGKEFSVQFSEGTGGPLSSAADVRTFSIAVGKAEWHAPGNDIARTDIERDIDLPLYLYFDFTESATAASKYLVSCRPLQLRNDKESKQMKEARTFINAHPEWTDAEESEAVNKLGLSFGPKSRTAVLSLIPLKDLSTLYGPLRITKAEFVMNGGGKCAGCSSADLRWWINADEVDTQRALQITIEPFQGKINGISEHRRPR